MAKEDRDDRAKAKADSKAEFKADLTRKKHKKKRKRRGGVSIRQMERLLRDIGGSEGSLLATLGSVPAFATAESMMTASQAQGQMMLGSVANQQRLNTLALIATGGCVMQMLKMGDTYFDDEDEEGGGLDADLLRGLAAGQNQF